jgi:ADP-ribose pyrophosphatase YjhB (NUDIX family)
MNAFNEEEYLELCRKFNTEGNIKDVTVRYESPYYFNRLKNMVQKDRRGEVVFCVVRPNGKPIAITCSEYPENTYRIPTGGIGHHEDIVAAVYREVKEELGLEVKIRSFAGVVRINFEYAMDHVMFYSYIFILDETGGRLLEDASDDEISAVREVDLPALDKIVEDLAHIPGKWKDWGQFRYVTTGAVVEYLKKNV